MSQKYERFGNFILLEKLAAGGMAEVFLAKSTGAVGVNKFVAIKRILPQFSKNDEFIQMFREEAKVSVNLNHSNVVSVYDFDIEHDQFYIVMEYVEGRNLRQIINELKKYNRKLDIKEAVYLVKETAAGLDHAHRCVDKNTGRLLNITHRDMSPQNIMVSFEGEAKVIDFGIAKKSDGQKEDTQAGTIKGKFAYMSPEQAEGGEVDLKTDIFALGIILWELLAGDRLFSSGSSEAAILRKVRECNIQPIRKFNPSVPPELEKILNKALAKDKKDRYENASNFHKELNRFLNTYAPDFTTDELCKNMIDCFKNEYQAHRAKLIEFSKIEVADLEPSAIEKVQELEKQKMASQVELPPSPNKKGPQPPPVPNEPRGLSSEQNSKVELQGLKAAAAEFGKPTSKQPLPPVHFNTSQNLNAHAADGTRFTQTTGLERSKKEQEPDQQDLIMKVVMVVVLLAVVFVGYNKFAVKNSQMAKTKATSKPEGKIELASQTGVNVSVKSEPPGAKIYINGEDSNELTPAFITLTNGKKAKIALRKDNYYAVDQYYDVTPQLVINETLQPMLKVAYVNINVQNGGAAPEIFINGEKIEGQLPITRRVIPADTEIKISGYSPFSNASDEVVVKLAPNATQTVDLILGRSKNLPARTTSSSENNLSNPSKSLPADGPRDFDPDSNK